MIASMDELTKYLAVIQQERREEIKCELTPALSARMNDAVLVEAVVTGLPMVQGIRHRIVRNRGRGTVLTAKVQYRQGVKMLEAFLSGAPLTREEAIGLEIARSIVDESLQLATEARFQHVYDWICRNICYVNTAPGKKGYERLVSAGSVLSDRQANCQGYADVLYLLCSMCGIPIEYRCARGERRLHVWNAVLLNDEWLEVDASRGARASQLMDYSNGTAYCKSKRRVHRP